jgi:Arc/MetJ family transcription regulator
VIKITVQLDDALLARAAELLGTRDRGELLNEGLRALIQRESARRLAKLGGSIPDATAPPRRRS